MTYKFVTSEEIGFILPKDYWEIIDRLFRERNAYREVAILLYAKQLTVKAEGGTVEADFIDAEAARIMEGKK